jgi:hypothetical protein
MSSAVSGEKKIEEVKMKTNLRPTRNVTRLVSILALLGLILVALPVFAGGETESAAATSSSLS